MVSTRSHSGGPEGAFDSEKYDIEGKISQGGMGAIYRVYDRDLKRTSVLKVALPSVMEDSHRRAMDFICISPSRFWRWAVFTEV